MLNAAADALLRGECGLFSRCCFGVGCVECRLLAVHAGTGGCFWALSDGHALRVRALRVRRLRSALRVRSFLSSSKVTFGSDVHFGTEMNMLGPQAFSRPWPFVCGRRRASVLVCVVKLACGLGSSLRTLYHCRMILPRSWNTHMEVLSYSGGSCFVSETKKDSTGPSGSKGPPGPQGFSGTKKANKLTKQDSSGNGICGSHLHVDVDLPFSFSSLPRWMLFESL